MWIRERSSRLKVTVVAGVCAFALTAAGCSGAASDDSPEAPAGSDDSVTLKMLRCNREGFSKRCKSVTDAYEAAHPNVTIPQLDNTDSSTYNANIKMLASSDDAPDLIEVGQGNSQMVPLVEADLLVPLDKYDASYQWSERFDPTLLDESRAADDGNSWGAGTLYGVPLRREHDRAVLQPRKGGGAGDRSVLVHVDRRRHRRVRESKGRRSGPDHGRPGRSGR